jgi:predicted HicB family RNase H-like nuclease
MKASFANSTDSVDAVTFTPEMYSISIRRENVDGDLYYVGRVTEFPDVAVFEDSADEAYRSTVSALGDLMIHLREQGIAVPVPLEENNEFSGRVTFRMPKTLHRRVDTCAKREGVSINTLLVAAAENYIVGAAFGEIKFDPVQCRHVGTSFAASNVLTELNNVVVTINGTAARAYLSGSHSSEGWKASAVTASASHLDEWMTDDPLQRHFFPLFTR